jgi:membrane-associated phospholipid phosphatase
VAPGERTDDVTRYLVVITDFGDLAVLVPLAVAIPIWLHRVSGVTAQWILALSICVGLTALLKIVFYGCPPAGDMHSPSGHASLSTLVYGGLALITAAPYPGLRRVVVIGVGAGLVLAIAVSRLLLDAHSLAEVGLGLIIGIFSLALFGHKYLQSPSRKVWPLLVAAGVLISILHGSELQAEEILHRITGYVPLHCG